MQFELLLFPYFFENTKDCDCLTIDKKDIDCCYCNDTKTLDIYNLKEEQVKAILEGLKLLQNKNPNDKRVTKLLKSFMSHLNMFKKD